MLKAHAKLKLLKVRRIFWKKSISAPFCKHSAWEGTGGQLWWLLKKL